MDKVQSYIVERKLMKLKGFIIVALLMLFGPVYSVSAVSSCVIDGIYPSENIGVFETGQEVSFSISYSVDEDVYISYSVSDIWDLQKDHGEILFQKSGNSVTINLGQFKAGWYRVRFYDTEGLQNHYCAFSVVEPLSSRRKVKNHFAADQAGQYMNWSREKREDYAKALRLAGIDMVRERMSDYDNSDYDAQIEAQVDALHNNDINIMEMLARNQYIDYGENLFDIYSKAKKNAEYYSKRVGIWESVNEADASGMTAPDEAASYFKARAIGIIDSGAKAAKTFGGLCNWNTSFTEIFMQNDVMSYADNFNLHSHRTGQTEGYNAFPSNPIKNARELSTVYGGGKPIWVSEAGISCAVDSNELLLDEYMPIQAKYVITSAVESIARGGTDKHFWFLARHYIENGREFGIFSKNDMPYAAYSSLATLTYYLGKGRILGELKEKPQSCVGYMFSDGENDVAVIWNTEDKTDYVQFNTDEDVQVINLVGDNTPIRYSEVNRKINIPITYYPVIVKFNGSTTGNYFPKEFPEYDEINVVTLSDSKKVVLKQNWKTKDIVNAQYRIEHGQSYLIALNVYNFSDTNMTGTITANTTEMLNITSKPTVKYSVPAGEKATITFTVAADNNYSAGGIAHLSFSGTANGEELSPSVSECYVLPDIDNIEFIYFNGCNNESEWQPNSSGHMTNFGQPTNNEGMKFVFNFNENVTDRWAYPRFSINAGTLGDSDGIVFKTAAYSSECDVSSMDMKVIVWTADGNSYIASGGNCADGIGIYSLKWDDFKKFSGTTKELNTADISTISIGFNAEYSPVEVSYSYTLKEFGYFKGNSPVSEEPTIIINGIHNGAKRIAHDTVMLSAQIPGDLKKIGVYLDYASCPYTNNGDGTIEIKLSDIAEGAHSLIVAGFDEFNHAVRTSVNFYAADKKNIYVKGTFFE